MGDFRLGEGRCILIIAWGKVQQDTACGPGIHGTGRAADDGVCPNGEQRRGRPFAQKRWSVVRGLSVGGSVNRVRRARNRGTLRLPRL